MRILSIMSNIFSIMTFLLVVAILSNKESYKMLKSSGKFKTNLFYKIPMILFVINLILNILEKSLFNNWSISLILLLIPILGYLTKK